MKHRILGLGGGTCALLLASMASAQQPTGPAPAPGAPPPPPGAQPPPGQQQPPPGQAGFSWGGTTAPQGDTGQKPTTDDAEKPKKKKLPWRGTSLTWEQTASAYTVGVGQDFQSRNPSYDMAFSLKPRYYVWDGEDQSVSVRGAIGAFREFTNSDTTTKRGEWSLDDATLTAAYVRTFHSDGDFSTDGSFRAPNLSFPTSKASANNGKILGLGASVGLGQTVPLLGSDRVALQTFTLQGVAGYSHTITEATTKTNDELDRVRLTPDGVSQPSDQLSGAMRAKHAASFTVTGELGVTDKVAWANSFSWRPSWKYQPTEADLCADNLLPTGCATPESIDDPQNFAVVTAFTSSVAVAVIPQMTVEAGYTNLTLQNGPDGQHRNVFYSPDSRFFLSITGKLDKIYESVTPDDSRSARTPAKRRVAKADPVATK